MTVNNRLIDFGCGLEKDGISPQIIWGEQGMAERARQFLPHSDFKITGIDLERPSDFSLADQGVDFQGVSLEEARNFAEQVDMIVWNYPDPADIYQGLNEGADKESPTVLLRKLITENLIDGGHLLLQTEMIMHEIWYVHEMHKVVIEHTRRMFFETGLRLIRREEEQVYKPTRYGGGIPFVYAKVWGEGSVVDPEPW